MYFRAIIALALILKEALAIDLGPYILKKHFRHHLRYCNWELYFIFSNAFLINLAEGSGGYENKTNIF